MTSITRKNIERGFCLTDLHQTLETAIKCVLSLWHGEFAISYKYGMLFFMKQAKNSPYLMVKFLCRNYIP